MSARIRNFSRSENVLLPAEYASTSNITVRFEAKFVKANYGGQGFAFEVYDVALVGRATQ